jgi:hypothetical protein
VGKAYNLAGVFEKESNESGAQCRRRDVAEDLRLDEVEGSPVPDRLGLAFPGGGIRSACVAVGIVQSFTRSGILRQVHHISAISGGRYSMSFLTAWIKHEQGLAAAKAQLGNHTSDGRPAKTTAAPDISSFSNRILCTCCTLG